MGEFGARAQSVPVENAGFEGEYELQDGQKELKIARGWAGWWVQGPESGQGWLVRPEFYPKGFGPVWAPMQDQAQGIQSTYATHWGGVVQAVQLPAGARELHLEARARIYSKHTNGSGGGLGTRVGIDPTGQTVSGTAPSIVWGSWQSQDSGWSVEEWRTLAAHLPYASGGTVSIWLESRNRWKARDNHTWWDQVSLTYEGGSPTPGPAPTPDLPDDIAQALDLILAAVGDLANRLTVLEQQLDGGLTNIAQVLGELQDILDPDNRDPELQAVIENERRVWDPETGTWD